MESRTNSAIRLVWQRISMKKVNTSRRVIEDMSRQRFIGFLFFCLTSQYVRPFAQIVPPAAPSSAQQSGPTMEQTVDFINDAFTQHGHFQVDFDPKWRVITLKILSQQLTRNSIVDQQGVKHDDPCSMTYSARNWMAARKGDWTPGDPFSYEETQFIALDKLDPRSLRISKDQSPSTPIRWYVHLDTEDNQGYFIAGKQDDAHKTSMTLGEFVDQDIAERVAKAYIHAIVLCHKPEAPSLF